MARQTVNKNRNKQNFTLPFILLFIGGNVLLLLAFTGLFGSDVIGFRREGLLSFNQISYIIGAIMLIDIVYELIVHNEFNKIRVFKEVETIKDNLTFTRLNYIIFIIILVSLLIVFTPINNFLPLSLYTFTMNFGQFAIILCLILFYVISGIYYLRLSSFCLKQEYKLMGIKKDVLTRDKVSFFILFSIPVCRMLNLLQRKKYFLNVNVAVKRDRKRRKDLEREAN